MERDQRPTFALAEVGGGDTTGRWKAHGPGHVEFDAEGCPLLEGVTEAGRRRLLDNLLEGRAALCLWLGLSASVLHESEAVGQGEERRGAVHGGRGCPHMSPVPMHGHSPPNDDQPSTTLSSSHGCGMGSSCRL